MLTQSVPIEQWTLYILSCFGIQKRPNGNPATDPLQVQTHAWLATDSPASTRLRRESVGDKKFNRKIKDRKMSKTKIK